MNPLVETSEISILNSFFNDINSTFVSDVAYHGCAIHISSV